MNLKLKEEWLATHENPGLSSRYWTIAWGDHLRGPSGKMDVKTACMQAYGMLSHNMLVVDLGTRIAQVKSSKYQAVAQNIRSLAENWWTGVFQLDWKTLEIGQIADWSDPPYGDLLPHLGQMLTKSKSSQQLSFEGRLTAAARIEDTREAIQAIKTLWHEIFGTNPDEDARLPVYVESAGYDWPVPDVPWERGAKLSVTLIKEAHVNE